MGPIVKCRVSRLMPDGLWSACLLEKSELKRFLGNTSH